MERVEGAREACSIGVRLDRYRDRMLLPQVAAFQHPLEIDLGTGNALAVHHLDRLLDERLESGVDVAECGLA